MRVGRKEKEGSMVERKESSYRRKCRFRGENFWFKGVSVLSKFIDKGKERVILKVKGKGVFFGW